MINSAFEAQFPNLFRKTTVDWAPLDIQFEALTTAPSENLIANVNVMPFVGQNCLIVQTEVGYWEIPGGTLEPGEPYLAAMERELMEEAGAELLSFTVFGAWLCHSHNPKPYRPHIPHPNFYRVVGYGQVEQVGKPLNPSDGEEVVQVLVLPVTEAVENFRRQNRADLAELYQLADFLRQNPTPDKFQGK